MLEILFGFTSNFLIECMVATLVFALVARFIAFRSSAYDKIFFSSFTREVEKSIQQEEFSKEKTDNVEAFMYRLLEKVSSQLPQRSMRFGKNFFKKTPPKFDSRVASAKNIVPLMDYVGGSDSLIHSLQGEVNAFKSATPPSFDDLTSRVMENDRHWSRLMGIPIDSVMRVIDTLPGLFIVLGIFGTFVGISQALPAIASIDFSDAEGSTAVLSVFVNDITFAMRTSVLGIIFSIILSFLNAMSPIRAVREEISTKLEQCLEHIWFYIHNDADSDASDVGEQNRRIIELLGSIDKKLGNDLRKQGAA
jgi:hypothetical protein